jgi:hypothetical protein
MLKVAVVAAGHIATDAGPVSTELLLARVTEAPPLGAGWGKVTAQVAESCGPRMEGLQTSVGFASPTTTAARLSPVLTERPL